jgi:hypothetical protein
MVSRIHDFTKAENHTEFVGQTPGLRGSRWTRRSFN